MNENFLQYLWKYRLFNNHDLKTTQGESLQIIQVGEHNTNAGPDFFNARIQCGATILAGNIEVHKLSSEWLRHGHQRDKSYQNIILHVVYEDDERLQSASGEFFLTLELKHRISRVLVRKYDELLLPQPFIPCASHWPKVDGFIKDALVQRLLIERMEMKCEAIEALLLETCNNWEEAFYVTLARNFGFRINALPFEMLVRQLPLSVFAKNKANIFQTEAILFGVSGFLNNSKSNEKYYLDLCREYVYQKQKHKFQEIDVTLWKFLRLRPANFPQIRIAQFANLIYRSVHLFSKIIEDTKAQNLKSLFNCSATLFWDTHYTFNDESTKRKKNIGEDAVNNILINTVAPFLFLYGKRKFQPQHLDSALELLDSLPPENNMTIRKWEGLSTTIKNASYSQGLLQLKRVYCDEKKCLHCSVGLKILKEE